LYKEYKSDYSTNAIKIGKFCWCKTPLIAGNSLV
jgi:hypothetical protein